MLTEYFSFVMRPSSLGGGRIMRRTLSVCPSVCLSVRPVRGSSFVIVYIRTVLRANIQNSFAYEPASRVYLSARAEGRISYGHLGRTNLLYIKIQSTSADFRHYHRNSCNCVSLQIFRSFRYAKIHCTRRLWSTLCVLFHKAG